jgi:cell division protein FtsA
VQTVENKKHNFICLDVGSHKIAALAARLNSENEVDVIDYGMYAAEGIKAGVIVDFQKAERSIENAVYNLEKNIGSHIDSSVVALSGAQACSRYLSQSVSITGSGVTKSDINALMTKAVRVAGAEDRSILHCFPIEFFVDGQGAIKNPAGMSGSKLGASLHAVAADASALLNLSNCFSKCHVKVEEFFSAPIAAGFAALENNEQEHGPIVIDCGAATTSFTIFSKGTPVFSDYVPVGGWHVSNDIAQVLSLGFAAAENLKVLYADLNENAPERAFEVNFDDQDRKIDSALLNEIARSRALETFHLIKAKLDKLDPDLLSGQNIVLTGGAANASGMEAVCSAVFKTSRIKDFARQHDGMLSGDSSLQSYPAVLGMLAYRMKHFASYHLTSSSVEQKPSLWHGFMETIRSYFK